MCQLCLCQISSRTKRDTDYEQWVEKELGLPKVFSGDGYDVCISVEETELCMLLMTVISLLYIVITTIY